MRKQIAIYVRVSTSGQSCEMQVRELRRYANARGWDVVQVFEDKASGKNANRHSFRNMMLAARQRQFDVLLVFKLDRLCRSLRDLVTTLQELADLGVEFVSLKDSIDMTSASGRLLTHLLASFAEFERDLIVERVRSGLANAKAKGVKLGRPATSPTRRILELHTKGLSVRKIAQEVGCSKSAVHKTLKNGSQKVK